jgi:hypothetical protein
VGLLQLPCSIKGVLGRVSCPKPEASSADPGSSWAMHMVNGRISYQTECQPSDSPGTQRSSSQRPFPSPPILRPSINLSYIPNLQDILQLRLLLRLYSFLSNTSTRLTTPFLIPSDSSPSNCCSFYSARLPSTTFVRFLALQSSRSAPFAFASTTFLTQRHDGKHSLLTILTWSLFNVHVL